MAPCHSSSDLSGESATLLARIEHLRQCLPFRELPANYSSGYPIPGVKQTPAAVLIPLVVRESGITVLLTQRTAHLNDHAGQVSFPGGRCEDSDPDAIFTALREAEEEVGLEPSQVTVQGILPDYYTGTGFRVTPVLGLVTPPLNLKLDDFEVAEVFEVPLSYVLDRANWRIDTFERNGRPRQFWATDWHSFYIWGATAGMLVNLITLMENL